MFAASGRDGVAAELSGGREIWPGRVRKRATRGGVSPGRFWASPGVARREGRLLRGVGGHGGFGMPATELLVVAGVDDKSLGGLGPGRD